MASDFPRDRPLGFIDGDFGEAGVRVTSLTAAASSASSALFWLNKEMRSFRDPPTSSVTSEVPRGRFRFAGGGSIADTGGAIIGDDLGDIGLSSPMKLVRDSFGAGFGSACSFAWKMDRRARNVPTSVCTGLS